MNFHSVLCVSKDDDRRCGLFECIAEHLCLGVVAGSPTNNLFNCTSTTTLPGSPMVTCTEAW